MLEQFSQLVSAESRLFAIKYVYTPLEVKYVLLLVVQLFYEVRKDWVHRGDGVCVQKDEQDKSFAKGTKLFP